MTKKRKHIDLRCVDTRNIWQKLGYPPGQFCSYLDEKFPKLETAKCEVVYSGRNNSDIVLGRDRNASLASGNGGSGGTHCGMIDIVVGRLSGIQPDKQECERLTSPNFAADAARIYLTQRGDIDTYFGIPEGRVTESTFNSSGVGIKADHTRIIGRQSVRIYAGKMHFEGLGRKGELNSKGGEISTGGVIELIAGKRQTIHPAVRGGHLLTALRSMYELIRQCFAAHHSQSMILTKLMSYLASHTHVGVLGPVAPDPGLMAISFESIGKEVIFQFDQMMSQFNATFEEMNFTGVGDPDGFGTLPGISDVLSTSVYLT